jgi:non-ribosomal peptide synthetase component F
MAAPRGSRRLEAPDRKLLEEWNATKASFPEDACIHEVFAEQVRRSPDAIAVVSDGCELTYAEVEERADRVAAHLRSVDVGPDRIVGVSIRRSPELIVSLLGVLKAGGAYLPLDATYPADRLSFMLDDVGATIVLSDRDSCAALPVAKTQVLAVEDLLASPPPRADSLAVAFTTNLAYVMYTSGSTGTPKGVAITHRNVLRLAKGVTYVRLGEEETVLQFAPVAFDASTFEIWGTLLNGARLAVPPASARGPQELAEAIARFGVSTLWLTAPLFHEVVDHHPAALDRVRQLLVGGDVVSPERVRKLMAHRAMTHGNELVVVNGYGPTETTTFATCFPVRE